MLTGLDPATQAWRIINPSQRIGDPVARERLLWPCLDEDYRCSGSAAGQANRFPQPVQGPNVMSEEHRGRGGFNLSGARARPPPKALRHLGIGVQDPVSLPKPSGTMHGPYFAPTQYCVKRLGNDDYIAVTQLRSCTGIAAYDPVTDVSGMYHFGGQFGNEESELTLFFLRMVNHGASLQRLQISLSGSVKCAHVQKVIGFLQSRKMYRPTMLRIYEVPVDARGGDSAFYLLLGGRVAHALV